MEAYLRKHDKFEKINNGIVHFKRVKANLDSEKDFKKLVEKIKQIKDSQSVKELKRNYKKIFETGKIDVDELMNKVESVKEEAPTTAKF